MMDLHFNQSLATGYHSGSQISRVVTRVDEAHQPYTKVWDFSYLCKEK